MNEQWQELKETITEMRDNDGTGTQQDVCKFLVNYMDVLEKQMQEPKIKIGHWILGICDNCGYDWGKNAPIASVPNFCPSCGYPMVKPREK